MHPLGDAGDPLSQLDSDNDLEPGDGVLAMQLPEGYGLQEHPPTVLDRALVKRSVFLRRGLGWFLCQTTLTAAPQTSHMYDYRVQLAFDLNTIAVKLPLGAYNIDEENTPVGAWALLGPINGSNGLVEEREQGRRTGRARTPMISYATSISRDEGIG